jgi:hypothetical protein
MPAKLSTTVDKIQLIPNSINEGIVSEFYSYMKVLGLQKIINTTALKL